MPLATRIGSPGRQTRLVVKLYQAAPFARPDGVDHHVGDLGGPVAGHDQTSYTDRPSCGVPLQLDPAKQIIREQARRHHNATPVTDARFADARQVGCETSEAKEFDRRRLARGLAAHDRPIRHHGWTVTLQQDRSAALLGR
jgi:hypothetical protein